MFSIIRNRKRRIAAAALPVGVTAAFAFAAWTVDSEGPGTSKGGTLSTPTVQAGTAAPTATCLPGGTCPGTFKVTNSNSTALQITGVQMASPTKAQFDTTSDTTACPVVNMSENPETLSTPIDVPPGVTEVTIPDAYKMASSAPTGCQGITFTIAAGLRFSTK